MLSGSIVQFPDGNPENTTVPFALTQVGCVMVNVGIAGADGCAFIKMFTDSETQPLSLVTVKL